MDRQLRRLQLCELEILKDVTLICEDNKLQYFLAGGTLLGAVRHKGFIPWDDDIDISMPRKDYKKFIQICKTQMDSKYFLHCNDTDSTYWLPYIKVRKNGTVFDEEPIAAIDTHKGFWLDIFPLDNANKETSFLQRIQGRISKIINSIVFHKRGLVILHKKPGWKLKRFLCLMIPFSIHLLTKLQQRIMGWNKNDKAPYFTNIASRYDLIKQTIPKNKFLPGTYVEFEGSFFRAPNDWDYVLNRIYGAYMSIPPEENRQNHKPVRLIFGGE
jgi:lipopolysaccharide cholinephosphotransferase